MSDIEKVSGEEQKEVQTQSDSGLTLLPAVDIHEDPSGITLHADMPGVNRERLNVQVDADSLLIEGDVELAMPKSMQALYADVRATRFRRSFTLSSELDTEAVEANLKDGVLTLRLPKKVAHQPRKIQVQSV
jgi:HSP20 family molecular chaperone IbpA